MNTEATTDRELETLGTTMVDASLQAPTVTMRSRINPKCNAVGLTTKQRSRSRVAKEDRDFVKAFTPNKFGEYE